MASSPAELRNQQQPQHGNVQNLRIGYDLTEEEKNVLRQCSQESFWSRALPLSVVSMTLTQVLIAKGILTASGRFGAIPKVAFAGFFGYMAGKISYQKTCLDRLMNLEGSPAGEALRQLKNRSMRQPGLPPKDVESSAAQGEPAPLNAASRQFDSSQYDSSPATIPFSSSFSESATSGITDNQVPEPAPLEEAAKRKYMTYDDLRNKNRETYEIIATPKTYTPGRHEPDRLPRKDVKTNKYGDVWEE
uniref:OCIA domain-containing protein 1 n=1 Tax=Leptobrachium leishanense TaxID=445787 RepID=A0A8C5MBD8_9ANUR